MLSRLRLLTQFLRAWQPIFRLVAIPILPSPSKAMIRILLVETRLPSLKTASNFCLVSPFLRRDIVAALVAASLQRVLAIGRAHPDSESVRLLSMAVIWLVGPFHINQSSRSKSDFV